MDNDTRGRDDTPLFISESVAVNIRRYLDAHRSGSSGATSVVANLATDSVGQVQAGSTPRGLVSPPVHLVIDALRRHRGRKTS